jgi:hypothetical protein
MHADIAVADSTHELLWRQMLRWLVNDVPDRVETIVDEESGRGDALSVRATVRDSAYLRRNGATVTGSVRGPDGTAQALSFDWTVDRDGEYSTTFMPSSDGLHEVHVRAVAGGDTSLSASAYVRIAEPVEEYFGAERRDGLLQQLARETGGLSYTPQRATDVARDLRFSGSGATAVRRLDLWDAPLVLMLLLLLLGTEWVLRRRRGLT